MKSSLRLTVHGLACGFIEQKSTDPEKFREADLYTELYMEHGVYHVRQFDRRPGAKEFQVFWNSFTRLSHARACFNAQAGDIIYKK